MSNLVESKSSASVLQMTEEELVSVLQSSLYPGAAMPSIKMVIGYCKAAGLDPMQKPVHIVPMWDSKAKALRDVIMPGVGLYRTQASRTGQFAGMTEPEYGPMVSEKIGGTQISYPEFAKVTVKRLLPNGTMAEFTATEYWLENYAVKGGQEKSIAPNAMWLKRPRGQIAKCAAAQALRVAFPELGAQATAEEMEGKTYEDDRPSRPSAALLANQQNAEPTASPELLASARAAADHGKAAFEKFWKGLQPANRGALRNEISDLQARCLEADTVQVSAEPVKATKQPAAETVVPVTAAAVDAFDAGLIGGGDDYFPQ